MKDILIIALGVALAPVILPILALLFPIWLIMVVRMHYIRKERGWY